MLSRFRYSLYTRSTVLSFISSVVIQFAFGKYCFVKGVKYKSFYSCPQSKIITSSTIYLVLLFDMK